MIRYILKFKFQDRLTPKSHTTVPERIDYKHIQLLKVETLLQLDSGEKIQIITMAWCTNTYDGDNLLLSYSETNNAAW